MQSATLAHAVQSDAELPVGRLGSALLVAAKPPSPSALLAFRWGVDALTSVGATASTSGRIQLAHASSHVSQSRLGIFAAGRIPAQPRDDRNEEVVPACLETETCVRTVQGVVHV